MQEERHSFQRASIASRRSHSSDRASFNILEDLGGRVPRHADLIYVMSIESQASKRDRGSDIDKFASSSARQSNEAVGGITMDIEPVASNRGSHGLLGRHDPKDLQPYIEEAQRVHECDCYRECEGENCECFRSLLFEPCVEGKCCLGCINLKNQRILAVQSSKQGQDIPLGSTTLKSGCSCKKTKCLKLYCECFARKGFCGDNCNCEECHNRVESEARSAALTQNPGSKQQIKGCFCKKTKCQKKYCACYGNNLKCNKLCQCQNCNNMDSELKTLRNYSSPQQQPFYPPMPLPVPVDRLPSQIEFTQFEMPWKFGQMSLNDS